MVPVLVFRPRTILSLALLAMPALYADVTLRYRTETQYQFGVGPQVTKALAGIESALPKDLVVQLKNGKGFTESGLNVSICDFTKQEITLLDREGKRYATVPYRQIEDEVAGAMPPMPEQAKAAAAQMKTHVEAKTTGRTATIQGVEAEEHEIVATMDAPPGYPGGSRPMMRMVADFWLAKTGETLRVPAIREAAGYNLFAAATMNPLGGMKKIFGNMPGGDVAAAIEKELRSGGSMVLLRSQIKLFMPAIAAIMKQKGAEGADTDTPLMQTTQELTELSTGAVPDSVFQIPEGYQSTAAVDILRSMMKVPLGGQ
jgi:hypothetical protein